MPGLDDALAPNGGGEADHQRPRLDSPNVKNVQWINGWNKT